MTARSFGFLVAVLTALSSTGAAQGKPIPAKASFWDDTATESPIYPVGDAAPVYRAVLDLLYLDGDKRPPVIIMHDSTEGVMGGPCPFAKCPGLSGWTHKSKIDTGTVMSFARLTRRRPRITQFGYPIPIVFLSYDDVQRMEADGRAVLALHPVPNDLHLATGGFWVALKQKYPGAWGVTTFSKVGFNRQHTEALMQAHQWCSDDCRVHETLFLRKTNGRWRVVERIPAEIDPGSSASARYVGPAGATPKESEVIPVQRPRTPSEATARAGVYRAILDSLYFVEGGGGARMVVLTNWFNSFGKVPPHHSALDSALIQKFAFLGGIRAPLDAVTEYRVPVATLPVDSVSALRERGAALDAIPQTGYPFWLAFVKKFPGAWGMLGASRIAFNDDRSQALVYTHHACGNDCFNIDTWFLTRSGGTWEIAERMPSETPKEAAIEPLRYLGLDADAAASSPRRVQGILTDPATGKPIPRFEILVRRMLNSGINIDDPSLMTDSLGRFTLSNLPLNAAVVLIFHCPSGTHDPVLATPLYARAGLDTTMNVSFEIGQCPRTPPAP